jgi:hypothetical protein
LGPTPLMFVLWPPGQNTTLIPTPAGASNIEL